MKPNQLSQWALVCAELRRRGFLARVSIDADAVHLEVRLGNRQVKKMVATAEVEQAIPDIVSLWLGTMAEDINHYPRPRFQPWLAGGRDLEDPIPKTEK